MALQWLFLDLNGFFASCEQQDHPHLRGKPVAIVPSLTDSTCAIAASYEAKRYGIKTGTSVYDCKILCPNIHLQVARHKTYVQYHHKVIAAVEQCVPIDNVASIDEMACRLDIGQNQPDTARALAHKIKLALREQVGECLTASIGIAPNPFLAKLASDMQKPDGLVLLDTPDLPHALAHLSLQDLCGIGHNMLARLHDGGIFSIQDLYKASAEDLRRIWGGIEGERFYALLRGDEIYRPPTERHSLSHQHVLEPPLRHYQGGKSFARYLLMKAAQRLRTLELFCKHLSVHIKFQKPNGYWSDDLRFPETQDSQTLLRYLEKMWAKVPKDHSPLRVTVVVSDFIAADRHQGDLFDNPQRQIVSKKLHHALDGINKRYGYGTIGFGNIKPDFRAFNGRIAFQKVPDWEEF